MDGIERHSSSVNGKKTWIKTFFDHTCSLNHKHEISVAYDFEKEKFEINKEQHMSLERKKTLEQEILKYCEEKVCYYCGKDVEREQLAGFTSSSNYFSRVEYLVDSNCLKEKEWIKWEDNFETLDDYLEFFDYKGDEELKDCKDLSNYPRCFEAPRSADYFIRPINLNDGSFITDFDREMIAKFRKEVDLEWERDPGDIEIVSSGKTERSMAKEKENECKEHEWYNSSASRQRCKKCYLLKK